MKREDFIKRCALMGLGSTLLPTFLSSCKKEDSEDIVLNFSGKVIIIGAGAAGLMAGYTLARYGIDFEILEASSIFGGRVRKNATLADFPIDIGAEWIHTKPNVFADLVDNEEIKETIDLISYRPKEVKTWRGGKLRNLNVAQFFYKEYKFKSSTWFDFFDQFIVPSIQDKIKYNKVVTEINYESTEILVRTSDGDEFLGDKIITTVPIKILQSGDINFVPALPESKVSVLNKMVIPPGIKVFIKFKERFYPDLLSVGGLLITDVEEPALYYDAAFKKDSQDNILGLFWVADKAKKLTELSDEEIIQEVLKELDEIFEGKATENYMEHIIQNWSKEPFIQGSYSHYGSEAQDYISTLSEPIQEKVYFAGEALNASEWSTVHGAGFSGVEQAKVILEGS
ncbi:MAG: FAD-dependent oxidoreductase [Flavobacteriales bacterium]|nr:FAD-dependent oxidoreductase [Flavobacteriales bacterium]